jgi:hypothetical protein
MAFALSTLATLFLYLAFRAMRQSSKANAVVDEGRVALDALSSMNRNPYTKAARQQAAMILGDTTVPTSKVQAEAQPNQTVQAAKPATAQQPYMVVSFADFAAVAAPAPLANYGLCRSCGVEKENGVKCVYCGNFLND